MQLKIQQFSSNLGGIIFKKKRSIIHFFKCLGIFKYILLYVKLSITSAKIAYLNDHKILNKVVIIT